MARILVEERHWPLVLVAWPEHRVTDADLEEYLEASKRQLNRGRHVVLHLTDGASGLGARHRRIMAQHIRQHTEQLRENVLGGAIVLRNPVLRGMIIATNWLAPPVSPQRIFATREAAEVWLEQRLQEAGIGFAIAPLFA